MNNCKENRTGWILCSSKGFPGKYYYFNVTSGEAVWSFNDKSKNIFNQVQDDNHNLGHKSLMYPEPDTPPFITKSTSNNSISMPNITRQVTNTEINIEPMFSQSYSRCNNQHDINTETNIQQIPGQSISRPNYDQYQVTNSETNSQPIYGQSFLSHNNSPQVTCTLSNNQPTIGHLASQPNKNQHQETNMERNTIPIFQQSFQPPNNNQDNRSTSAEPNNKPTSGQCLPKCTNECLLNVMPISWIPVMQPLFLPHNFKNILKHMDLTNGSNLFNSHFYNTPLNINYLDSVLQNHCQKEVNTHSDFDNNHKKEQDKKCFIYQSETDQRSGLKRQNSDLFNSPQNVLENKERCGDEKIATQSRKVFYRCTTTETNFSTNQNPVYTSSHNLSNVNMRPMQSQLKPTNTLNSSLNYVKKIFPESEELKNAHEKPWIKNLVQNIECRNKTPGIFHEIIDKNNTHNRQLQRPTVNDNKNEYKMAPGHHFEINSRHSKVTEQSILTNNGETPMTDLTKQDLGSNDLRYILLAKQRLGEKDSYITDNGKLRLKNKSMEENLINRMDEWTCCFLQILENCLLEILYNTDKLFHSKIPSNIQEVVQTIAEMYGEFMPLRISAEQLSMVLCFYQQKGTANLSASEFIDMYNYGIDVLLSLQEILPNTEIIEETKYLLHNVAKMMENSPADDELDDIQNVTSINECVNKKTDYYVKQPAEIIQYLKKYFPLWKDDESFNNTEDNTKYNKLIEPKIVRTVGKNLNQLRIDKSKNITITNIQNKNSTNLVENYQYGNTYTKNTQPVIIRNVKLIDAYEKKFSVHKSNFDNEITFDSPKDMSDLRRQNCDVVTVTKDDVTDDSRFGSHELHSYYVVKTFLMEISSSFLITHSFIYTNLLEFQSKSMEDNKREIYMKTYQTRILINKIIEKLKYIIERESNERTTLKSRLIKVGVHLLENTTIVRYRQIIIKCLEQAEMLEDSLQDMLNIIDGVYTDNVRTNMKTVYYNIFEG